MTTTLEPRTWKHTILQGGDEETLRELRAEADRLKPRTKRGEGDDLLASDDPWDAYDYAAEKADAFAAEAEARGVTVILRTLGRKAWRDLVAAHPPRADDKDDLAAGVNLEEFPEALVPPCVASIGAASFTDGELSDLLDAMTPAQFDLLAAAAWNLHKALGANPKDRLLSAPMES